MPDASERAIHARLIEVWREMRRGEAMQAYRELQFEGLVVTELGQSDALQLIGEAGELRVGQLASAMRIERSTATRTVHRLEALGLAVRAGVHSQSLPYAQSVLVRLTPLGMNVSHAISDRRLELIAEMCQGMSVEELDQVVRTLEVLVRGLDRVVSSHAAERHATVE